MLPFQQYLMTLHMANPNKQSACYCVATILWRCTLLTSGYCCLEIKEESKISSYCLQSNPVTLIAKYMCMTWYSFVSQ